MLSELDRISGRLEALKARRMELIRQLRVGGVSLRRIAGAAHISHQTVKNLTEGRGSSSGV